MIVVVEERVVVVLDGEVMMLRERTFVFKRCEKVCLLLVQLINNVMMVKVDVVVFSSLMI